MSDILLVGIIWDDHINYKKYSTVLEMPYCSFKCDKENGSQICQNWALSKSKPVRYKIDRIIETYLKDDITEAIVFQGLEPFDTFDELLQFVKEFRKVCNDDIVIYTGYNRNEIEDKIEELKQYQNIIIKFGRYLPNQKSHIDEVLKVSLASDNQYAEKIS